MKKLLVLVGIVLSIAAQSWAGGIPQVVLDQLDKSGETVVGKIFVETINRMGVAGSGFVVDKNGLIATNEHVIRDGANGVIKLGSKAYRLNRIIYSNKSYDVALVQINIAKPLQATELGDYNNEKIGNTVYVISSPEGLENALTQGQITGNIKNISGGIYFPLSATVDHGSSGAPVFNGKGEVIGMIAQAKDGYIKDRNFAIPVNIIKDKIPSKTSTIEEPTEKTNEHFYIWIIIKNGYAQPVANLFFDREMYLTGEVLLSSASPDQLGNKYCTLRFGGVVCYNKEDIASIINQNADTQ